LVREIFGINVARLTTTLLSTFPLFLSNALFATRDYILTVFMIIALYFYLQKKAILYFIFGNLIVLTKETGLVLILSVAIVEFFYFFLRLWQKKLTKKDFKILFFFLPVLGILLWYRFLKELGSQPWQDHILMEEVRGKGSFYTVFYILTHFKTFSPWAKQHLKQLFILNFNWLYWLIFIGGTLIFLLSFLKRQKSLLFTFGLSKQEAQKTKFFLIIFIFTIGYIIGVLTFPTYTIPRYTLPLVPILIGGVTMIIDQFIIKKGNKTLNFATLVFLFFLVFVCLFFSIDPLSLKIWDKMEFYGEKLYNLKDDLAGNDGITYNLQYLFIVKKRTQHIKEVESQKKNLMDGENWAIFWDPNNDCKTFQILNFRLLPFHEACRK